MKEVVKGEDNSQRKYRISTDMVTSVLLNEIVYTAAGHIQTCNICSNTHCNLQCRIAF